MGTRGIHASANLATIQEYRDVSHPEPAMTLRAASDRAVNKFFLIEIMKGKDVILYSMSKIVALIVAQKF